MASALFAPDAVYGHQPGVFWPRLRTEAGEIRSRLHLAEDGADAVLWVFGAGGGLGGPAGGLYARLAAELVSDGVSSLELDYRLPGRLTDCVEDVQVGIAFLNGLGRERIVLVGHSFGGAVVITAGAREPAVAAVAALSSQTAGTDAVWQIAPRPVLFVHGTADDILPDRCSRDLYQRAREPKELILYPGGRHGLDECREALDAALMRWIGRVLTRGV